jgi:hypothetical protein
VNECGTKREDIIMGAPISALTAARHMCERSDWSLTNLKLQKMLYLAQMIYMGQFQERLINGAFEAWDYGPVLPAVYGEVKAFGGGAVRYLFGGSGVSDAEQLRFLKRLRDSWSTSPTGAAEPGLRTTGPVRAGS